MANSAFSLAEQLAQTAPDVIATVPLWSADPMAIYGIPLLTVILPLVASTLFMTIAWFGHLKYRLPMVAAILIGWLIALAEYSLSIPAIRAGYESGISLVQLKALHEVIGILVFVVFAMAYLKEKPSWAHLVGFGLIAAGLYLVFGA